MNFGGIFDLDKKKRRLDEITMQSENPAIWGQPEQMQKLNKEKAFNEKALLEWSRFHSGFEDAKVLLEMALEAQDEATFTELKSDLRMCFAELFSVIFFIFVYDK